MEKKVLRFVEDSNGCRIIFEYQNPKMIEALTELEKRSDDALAEVRSLLARTTTFALGLLVTTACIPGKEHFLATVNLLAETEEALVEIRDDFGRENPWLKEKESD